jgi:hypothetical protein
VPSDSPFGAGSADGSPGKGAAIIGTSSDH